MQKANFFINDSNDNNENDYAYLNFRLDGYNKDRQFIEMSKGYLDTAKYLLTSLAQDNSSRRADIEIFPTLFLLNHGIELMVKSLYFYSDLQDKKTHNLKSLMDYLLSQSPNLKTHLHSSKSYINILHNNDIFKTSKNLDFTRYSFNSDDEPFPHAQEIVEDNLKISISLLLNLVNSILEEFYILYHALDDDPDLFK
ncbi:hypothetical protein [Staphylococcus xylosus]|uniref:hypothetical protein n=1 Tax=Staphylococcus xylosus TaxID=1288 RepID=UPI002DB79DFE|nr:hypothetical protein [Staphylococcus xylosus]MEB8307598.1 hypothetical protein [Staphylococcus xylosus]